MSARRPEGVEHGRGADTGRSAPETNRASKKGPSERHRPRARESRTLWELLARRAALTPDRPVLLQDDRTLTFGELRARAERVAAGLYGMGVRPGTVVAWQLPTRIETVLLSFALARLGAVQSPVIPFYRDREVGFALRESKAEFFAVPGEWRGFDHTEMARRLGGTRRLRGVRPPPGRRPFGAPRPAGRRHLRPLDLLDLGHDLRPQGRPPHGPFTDRGRLLPRPRAPAQPGRRRLDRLPLRAHRRPGLHGDAAAVRLPGGDVRAVRAAGRAGGLPRARGDGGGRVDGVLLDVPGRAAQDSRASRSSPPCGCSRAAGRRSRRRSTTPSYGRWACSSPTGTA